MTDDYITYAYYLRPHSHVPGHMNMTDYPHVVALLAGRVYTWPRPRGKPGQRSYVPKSHPAYVYRDQLVALLQRGMAEGAPLEGPVAVAFTYHVAKYRGDGDNIEKLVLDALQRAGVIANDRQVKRMEWWERTLAVSQLRCEALDLAVRALPPQ